MKKLLSIVSLLLVSLWLVACGGDDEQGTVDVGLESEVSIIVPNGTPYLAIGGLLENEKINITAVSGPENLRAALLSGSHDIVIAPINLGSTTYNGGISKYQISHILTSNNAYIVTRSGNKLDTIADLVGQDVLGFGAAGIPGSILKKIYSDNNLDVSKIDFQYASSANVYSVFKGESTGAKYALMSEPEISRLVEQDKISVKTLDLCKELGVNVAQACVYVNPNSANQDDINKVLSLINANVKALNENPTAYADKVIPLDRVFEMTGRDVIIRSIPLTNIVFKEAKTNKSDVESILTILGVKVPNEEFYR